MNFPRSPYEQVGGLVHFGRMLDKIRLHVAGELPAPYLPFLGSAPNTPEVVRTRWDSRCCRFLKIDYQKLAEKVKHGETDEALLKWAFDRGRKPSDEEIEIWNAFILKRGWRDESTASLKEEVAKSGLDQDQFLTWADFSDAEEERPQRFPN